jgi:ABC-type dipeptide/oligopeptide/nickel transport system permease subunit
LLFAANFASAILVVFSGLGAQPHTQLGSIIKDHYSYIIPVNRIWLWFLVCHYVADIGFMMMGNALRDALDVKQIGALKQYF